MELTVNGRKHPWRQGLTVSALLEEVLGDKSGVVVEKNGTIIQREQYDDVPLNKGDLVEIIHFVGGG